jgi:hypothetical protein
MTVQELVDYCNENDIPLDTHIAMNAKDEYMLVEERIKIDEPYFGNCPYGWDFQQKNYPKNENGDIDWNKIELEIYKKPKFLVLHTGIG